MKQETELQLQAYLDGELNDREARQVAERVSSDSAARALLAELTATKQWLTGNEPLLVVPESREFYWSKIERGIDLAERENVRTEHRSPWSAWLRYLIPAAGVALAVGLALLFIHPKSPQPVAEPVSYLTEAENLSEYTTSFAFRSERENMFVVWISNKDPQPESKSRSTAEWDREVIYQ